MSKSDRKEKIDHTFGIAQRTLSTMRLCESVNLLHEAGRFLGVIERGVYSQKTYPFGWINKIYESDEIMNFTCAIAHGTLNKTKPIFGGK